MLLRLEAKCSDTCSIRNTLLQAGLVASQTCLTRPKKMYRNERMVRFLSETNVDVI